MLAAIDSSRGSRAMRCSPACTSRRKLRQAGQEYAIAAGSSRAARRSSTCARGKL